MVRCNAVMCEFNNEAACATENVHVVVNEDDVPACNVFGWDKEKSREWTMAAIYESAVQDFVRATDRLQKLVGALSIYCDHSNNARHVLISRKSRLYKLPGKTTLEKRLSKDYPMEIYKIIGGVKFFRLLRPEEIQDYLPWDEICNEH